MVRGPIGNNISRPRFPVNLHQGLYLHVLDKLIVDYTLARGPIGSNYLMAGPVCMHLFTQRVACLANLTDRIVCGDFHCIYVILTDRS